MTASENKIILDKGSDYRLQLKVKDDDGINDRDLTGWGWKFVILNKDGTTNDTISAAFPGTYTGDDLSNGACTVAIDSTITALMNTAIIIADNVFNTEYNYWYTLTIYQDGAGLDNDLATREMRVLRGKLAIRV